MLSNSLSRYGVVSKLLHWLSAITIFALFALGVWMVELDYYNEWYKAGPDIHKSIGVLLFIFTLARMIWKFSTIQPLPLDTHSPLIKKLTQLTHLTLYGLLLLIMLSGYLISTADGRAIDVFELFSLSAFGELFTNQEDIAGEIHEVAAYVLMGLAVLHIVAAIKHHVIDKDSTLKRMI